MRFQVPIAVVVALLGYASLHAIYFSVANSVDVFSLVSEAGIAAALVILLFLSASVKETEGIVWLFLVGLSIMALAALTDLLGEVFVQPKLLTTFAEDVAMLLGIIFVVEGAYKWLKYNERMQKLLREKSGIDETTGLLNRKSLFQKAYMEMEHSRRNGTELALIVIDIDHFKNLNDKYGHHYADDIMAEVSHRMEDVIRRNDVLCRWSEDKFVLLVPECDSNTSGQIAEKIRAVIDTSSMLAEEKDIHVTVSLGVARLHKEDASIESVIDRADHALDHSKVTGNCISLEQAA